MVRATLWAGLLFVLAGSVLRAASTGTRFVFMREPPVSYLERFLERLDIERNNINHPYAGFTDPATADGNGAAPPEPPPGFKERTVRVRLGNGNMTYEQGRKALLQWQMHDGSPWARIKLGRRLGGKHSLPNMATVAKSLGGLTWVINPCKVIYERKDARLRFLAPPVSDEDSASPDWRKLFDRVNIFRHDGKDQARLWAGKSPATAPRWAQFSPGEGHKGKQAAVAYATKEGHLFRGEERMRVVWFCGRGGDDSVWFEVYSASRGAGRIGELVFPLAQSMQRKFFREEAETIRRIVDEQHGHV